MTKKTTSTIVTDDGLAPEDWCHGFTAFDALAANEAAPVLAVDLRPEDDPARLTGRLDEIDLIRVAFPAFSDGRGFTIARQLRDMGFAGRLRAAGHVIADQYAMARRAGFDEVEIDATLAARQPADQWRARAEWRTHDYQSRLRGAAFS